MRYKEIFVDWDGTLSSSRFWSRWANGDEGDKKYELIQQELFDSAEGQLIVQDWMRGVRSSENVLHYLSDATSIPFAELENELPYSAENMTFIDYGAVEKIQSIRKLGAKVVIATDNMDVFRLATIKALGLDDLFDGILTSDTTGALKPEFNLDGTSPFFGHYMTQNNLNPGDSVIIDDDKNTQVIESIGIDFLHVSSMRSLSDHLDTIIKS